MQENTGYLVFLALQFTALPVRLLTVPLFTLTSNIFFRADHLEFIRESYICSTCICSTWSSTSFCFFLQVTNLSAMCCKGQHFVLTVLCIFKCDHFGDKIAFSSKIVPLYAAWQQHCNTERPCLCRNAIWGFLQVLKILESVFILEHFDKLSKKTQTIKSA